MKKLLQCNDFAEAKRLNDRIEPLTRVFYADPFVDMRNRLKEALVLLGRLPRAVVRPLAEPPAGRPTTPPRALSLPSQTLQSPHG